jgi:signal transduction histidine kinase/CheY-like chemotaxis protein
VDWRRAFRDHLARCRRSDDVEKCELVLCCRDAKEVPVEIQTKRFDPTDHEGITYQAVVIDLSERKRNEAERRRIEGEREHIAREESAARAESEAKDRFLAVLSHELRTPLTPVLLTLESLDEVEGVLPPVRRGLAVIRRNSEVLARLIDDLLDVTRIVHEKLHLTKTPVSLEAVLRSVVEMCESDLEHLGVRLDLRLETCESWILGDALRLRQIFWNLLRNAIQHTPPRGRIAISCEMASSRSVRVSVSDTGEGIEADDAERLFEPFQQSRKARPGSGLGLGLAICRGLVEAHGGSIRVASAGPDNGATFVVELPTCLPPPRAAGEPAAPVEREPLRVLVVEDHADTAEAMRMVLSRYGYAVRVASTLEEARRAADDPFDVLVSDLQLPDGSGLDLMRGLSAEHEVKGIAMSGFGSPKDVSRSLEAGFHLHLVKPVDIHRMVDAIRELAHAEDDASRRA